MCSEWFNLCNGIHKVKANRFLDMDIFPLNNMSINFFSLLVYQFKWLTTGTLYWSMIYLHLLGSATGRILKKHWWRERSPCHFQVAWPCLAGNRPGVPAGQSWLSSSETNKSFFLITDACGNMFVVRFHMGLDHLKYLYIKHLKIL